MVLKVNKNISKYLINELGEVFSIDSGEKIEMINKTQYRLETDEVFNSILKKRKSNIKRRFTREQIIKIWGDIESKTLSDIEENKIKEDPVNESNDVKSGVMVEGITYKTVGEASKKTGISYQTIKNRIKKQVDGYKTINNK